jgi:hypothetical protein
MAEEEIKADLSSLGKPNWRQIQRTLARAEGFPQRARASGEVKA